MSPFLIFFRGKGRNLSPQFRPQIRAFYPPKRLFLFSAFGLVSLVLCFGSWVLGFGFWVLPDPAFQFCQYGFCVANPVARRPLPVEPVVCDNVLLDFLTADKHCRVVFIA
jgi:hypothetical protein